MFKSYSKAYPTLGLTKEEFGDFLIEECSVRSQFRYIMWLDVMSSNTSQEKIQLKYIRVVLPYLVLLTVAISADLTYLKYKSFSLIYLLNACYLFQWRRGDCTRTTLQRMMRHHDHHHNSFKKYAAKNRPFEFNIAMTKPLLTYAGFLR